MRIDRRSLTALCLVVVAAGTSWGLVETASSDNPRTLLFAGLAAIGTVIVLAGARVCLWAILCLSTVGWTPVLWKFGQVDFRVDDVLFVAALLWIVSTRSFGAAPHRRAEEVAFNWLPSLLLLIYIGLTVCLVAVTDPDEVLNPLVSFVRLIQTFSLVWVAFVVIRTAQDARRTALVLVAAGVLAVGLALRQAWLEGLAADERFGGLLTVNTFGLVGGMLIAWSLAYTTQGRRLVPMSMAFVGLLGLLLSRSIGALLSVLLMAALYLILSPRQTSRRMFRNRLAWLAASILPLTLLALSGIYLLRPQSLPTSAEFRASSTFHRVVVGGAGIQLFLQHPVVGVGWQRSSYPDVIGDEEIAFSLRRTFPHINTYLYPDVTPTTVHSTYIQVLAELGAIGGGLFVGVLYGLLRGAAETVRRADPAARDEAIFFSSSLFLVLVWLNDNPLFGGQTETVLLAVSIGVLASLSVKRERPDAAATSERSR